MKKKLICLALAAVLLLACVPSAFAITNLDVFATASFGRSYDVYSGPGEHYYRANSGKAQYGGGVARIYGVEGDWIMMGYQLGNGNYRIGFITRDALSTMGNVRGNINYNLKFNAVNAYADGNCPMTDDPVINNNAFYTIPQGTKVSVLGTMGTNWCYVEVLGSSSKMRGFVYTMHLRDAYGNLFVPPEPDPTEPPQDPTPNPWPTPTPYNPYYPPVTQAPVTQPPVTQPPAYNTYYHDTKKGEWLPTPQDVLFRDSWAVYSGPGDYYYRANNKKATMGGGWCQLYGIEISRVNGVEKKWALIGYGLSNGSFRFGYVNADAIPQAGLSIPYLDLRYTTRQLASDADLTDDILRYRPTVTTLKAGTYVLFLGYAFGSDTTWAYVEVYAEGSIMRGFIPLYALK